MTELLIFSPLLTSHILPFMHDSSLDSKLSTGHTFSDICMTSRHETMTWHDGVMRLARVTGSCHGLRDSIVTLRDGTVTSAVSATTSPLCSFTIVCNIGVYSTWWELFTKSHGLIHSLLLSIPGLVSGSDNKWRVSYGRQGYLKRIAELFLAQN